MTNIYGILIQTAPTARFRALSGWDTAYASREEAEACAARARKHDWNAVRVIEMAPDEARELGWTVGQ